LTQKLKCVMKSVDECFSKNKALTQKMKWWWEVNDEKCWWMFFKKWSIDTKIEVYNEKCFHLHVCFKSKNFSSTLKCECHEDLNHVLDDNKDFLKNEE
jgi:hypothetical protein